MIEATRENALAIFRLESKGEGGVTRRAELEILAAKGKTIPSLEAAIPEPAMDAFTMWLDLHAGRTSNGWGASPLTWLDLHAWSQMRGTKPTFTELELIRTIDRAFCEANAAKEN